MTHVPGSSDPAPLPPQAIVEVCLCHHARKAARVISRIFDEFLQPLGIKASQFNILTTIAAHDHTSAAVVARALCLDRTTLSRNLKPLRLAGLIAGEEGAGRRAGVLALTPQGYDLLTQAAPLWRQAQSRVTADLGAGQAGQLLQSLERAAKLT
jgi:DNA-binding MarR family transcriptional regulator